MGKLCGKEGLRRAVMIFSPVVIPQIQGAKALNVVEPRGISS